MKKAFSIVFLLCCLCFGAQAQVFILNDNIFQDRMGEIKATVLDSLTSEPVAFASVYVIPAKDTTITNFTLTDIKGEAKLEEVPFGNYSFHVEMMGYKPFVKERYIRDSQVDLGTIRLQVDEQFLQAATITDVGNPIVIKKDTVEFNASSFRVGANAMLKDLLQRMPGMEITEDGKVKFNGEEIDKLTVGGRTFFFNDQATALNNLPAAVVDKIRVIDRESEATRASGIQDGTREKVLDVGLKKEYEKGWFGNVGVKGGTTFGEKEGDDVLRDDRGLLYSGNALVSAYNEKDQVTVIGNVQNIDDSNVVFVMMDDEGETTSSAGQGLSTAAQLGLNVNSARIKDVETTVSVNAKYTDTDSGTRADRTTYQDDGNLFSKSENTGKSYASGVNLNMEFEKEQGKTWFNIRPYLVWNQSNSFGTSRSETSREGIFLNSSDNETHTFSDSKMADFYGDVTFRELWGKKNRTLRLRFETAYDVDGGNSSENTVLTTALGKDTRNMTYVTDGTNRILDGGLRYSEPLGEKWTLSTSADFSWSRRSNGRVAFDEAGVNDYYSAASEAHTMGQEYLLTAQYTFGEGSWITLGGSLSGILNETTSHSFGITAVTGEDEWNWFVTPSFRFQHSKGNDRFRVSASGYAMQPSSSRMLPVLNIANPSRLNLGNVYLKPYALTYFSMEWTRNNREKFSNLMLYAYGQVYSNPISNAQWYDASGVLYSIPVNTTKPNVTTTFQADYTTPLDAKKNWSLSLSGGFGVASSVTYQARTALAGLDKDTFDYSDFMEDFWGDASGNRFYGGESGFAESQTRSYAPMAGANVKYNQDRYSFAAGFFGRGYIVRYSLDPSIDMNSTNTSFFARGSYTTKHEFEFNTDLNYSIYTGYAAGYGLPEWQWNADINKNIGAFNLSVTVHDILNQTRNLSHTVTGNYEEDSYRLVMGRYILFGVKWNFGKMNAAHSARAQEAAWNLVF